MISLTTRSESPTLLYFNSVLSASLAQTRVLRELLLVVSDVVLRGRCVRVLRERPRVEQREAAGTEVDEAIGNNNGLIGKNKEPFEF